VDALLAALGEPRLRTAFLTCITLRSRLVRTRERRVVVKHNPDAPQKTLQALDRASHSAV